MTQLLVNTHRLTLRQQPDRQAQAIGLLQGGETVVVLGFSDEYYWANIKRKNGETGWASYKYFLGVPEKKHIRRNDYKWLKIAFGELNTAELPDPKENRRVTQYLKTCELSIDYINENSDETPWCSAFANWCIEKSGYQGTNSAWALSWKNWGIPSSKRRGALAVFKRFVTRNGVKETHGHVGFYLGKDSKHPDKIKILGGNQGNPGFVKISSYPIKSDRYELIGFRKPYTTQTKIIY